jgi:DNA-binding HxlR family transcriptional regulator
MANCELRPAVASREARAPYPFGPQSRDTSAPRVDGRLRFGELERRLTTITPKVLTQRLRQLERDGLVLRTYHPEIPPRVEYEISELGRSLAPLFATLATWSAANLGKVEKARLEYDTTDRSPIRRP